MGDDGTFARDPSFGVVVEGGQGRRLDSLDPSEIRDLISDRGVVLLKGFGADADAFEELTQELCPSHMPYVGGNSVREAVRPEALVYNVDSGTPRYLPIPAHGEMYYTGQRPTLVAFCCLHPAARAGETIVNSGVTLMERIRPRTRSLFEKRGIAYRRHFTTEQWQALYATDDRVAAEETLQANGLTTEWTDRGLAVEFLTSPIVRRENRPDAFMLAVLGWDLRHQFDKRAGIRLGDGARIGLRPVLDLGRVLRRSQVRIKWSAGDIALIDNRWVMHGRRPYLDRDRRILARFGVL